MRGYGGSSLYDEKSAYAQREVVQDMIELIDSLEREKAVWIGHDWGSPVAWNVALHHADRVHAVGSLCVPTVSQDIPSNLEHGDQPRNCIPLSEYPGAMGLPAPLL